MNDSGSSCCCATERQPRVSWLDWQLITAGDGGGGDDGKRPLGEGREWLKMLRYSVFGVAASTPRRLGAAADPGMVVRYEYCYLGSGGKGTLVCL